MGTALKIQSSNRITLGQLVLCGHGPLMIWFHDNIPSVPIGYVSKVIQGSPGVMVK